MYNKDYIIVRGHRVAQPSHKIDRLSCTQLLVGRLFHTVVAACSENVSRGWAYSKRAREKELEPAWYARGNASRLSPRPRFSEMGGPRHIGVTGFSSSRLQDGWQRVRRFLSRRGRTVSQYCCRLLLCFVRSCGPKCCF